MTYQLTKHDERKNAARLARSAIARACKDSRMVGALEELDDVPCTTIAAEIYKVALLKLLEIASDDDNTGQLYALRTLAEMRIKEAELLLKAKELAGDKEPEAVAPAANTNVLSKEEAVHVLRESMRLRSVR